MHFQQLASEEIVKNKMKENEQKVLIINELLKNY